ncbi:MAG: S-adenosyl-l-methionine hydroxide adenosyltransferase family protein, partial [Flammeovirgaceae bacterium]
MNSLRYSIIWFILLQTGITTTLRAQALVLQSDFGIEDGAVAAMKGVAFSVSPKISIFDLTHAIPAFNIWEASYRLHQAAPYWPAGTVFVSIVDPGVGSQRKSIALKTKSGHYFVSPDNGSLTLVAEQLGIDEIREIDEARNRLKNSEQSYTFHGRDVYAFTGARLAAGVIQFSEVGAQLPNELVRISYQKPTFENGVIRGTIPVLDIKYGNVWTNINKATIEKLALSKSDKIRVTINKGTTPVFDGEVPLVNTFAEVGVAQNLGYLNSLLNFSLGINQGNFSQQYKVFSGPEWNISVRKATSSTK